MKSFGASKEFIFGDDIDKAGILIDVFSPIREDFME